MPCIRKSSAKNRISVALLLVLQELLVKVDRLASTVHFRPPDLPKDKSYNHSSDNLQQLTGEYH